MNILVSIISEQIIPNYLLIKELQSQIDRYLFISSAKMEEQNKTNILCEVAGIDKNQRIKTLVVEDLLNSILVKLSKLNLPADATYYVNITGGTKIMSLAVWRFFAKFKNSRFFYVPIGKNVYTELFEDKKNINNTIGYKISVKEYLHLYDIRSETDDLRYDEKSIMHIFALMREKDFRQSNFIFDQKLMKEQQIYGQQFHTKCFEEYIYWRIRRLLNLSEHEILVGTKLFQISQEKKVEFYNNDNEVDVLFIYRNSPYIVECKYSLGSFKPNTEIIGNLIYKLSSINRRLGLSARACIMTLSDLKMLDDQAQINLKRRCEITRIHYPIIDINYILNNFDEALNNFLQ